MLYAEGREVSKDSKLAVEFLSKAAEQGAVLAQYKLVQMYGKGEDVPKDYVLCYVWLNLAVANGDKESENALVELSPGMTPESAKRNLDELKTMLTREQMTKAQELIRIYAERIKSAKGKSVR